MSRLSRSRLILKLINQDQFFRKPVQIHTTHFDSVLDTASGATDVLDTASDATDILDTAFGSDATNVFDTFADVTWMVEKPDGGDK